MILILKTRDEKIVDNQDKIMKMKTSLNEVERKKLWNPSLTYNLVSVNLKISVVSQLEITLKNVIIVYVGENMIFTFEWEQPEGNQKKRLSTIKNNKKGKKNKCWLFVFAIKKSKFFFVILMSSKLPNKNVCKIFILPPLRCMLSLALQIFAYPKRMQFIV